MEVKVGAEVGKLSFREVWLYLVIKEVFRKDLNFLEEILVG